MVTKQKSKYKCILQTLVLLILKRSPVIEIMLKRGNLIIINRLSNGLMFSYTQAVTTSWQHPYLHQGKKLLFGQVIFFLYYSVSMYLYLYYTFLLKHFLEEHQSSDMKRNREKTKSNWSSDFSYNSELNKRNTNKAQIDTKFRLKLSLKECIGVRVTWVHPNSSAAMLAIHIAVFILLMMWSVR